MEKIVFATNNSGKLEEVKKALPDFEIVGLKDIGCFEDLAEEQETLEGNAQQKAQYVFENYGIPCFADDTGLLIDALNGQPGVYSARFAGAHGDSEANMDKVLHMMEGQTNRNAAFKTVICYYNTSGARFYKGTCEGVILEKRSGSEGFGYDPIFQPNGFNRSFAEMSIEEKNVISHRGKAVKLFIEGIK